TWQVALHNRVRTLRSNKGERFSIWETGKGASRPRQVPMPRVASARRAKKPPSSRGAWRLTKISCGKRLMPALLQRRLLLGAGVHRPHPGDDLPQIVGGLDDAAEGRHRSNHDLGLDPLITRLAQIHRAERDQPEQGVVVGTVDPRVVGERHAHAAAAAATMTAVAAKGEILLVARISHVG